MILDVVVQELVHLNSRIYRTWRFNVERDCCAAFDLVDLVEFRIESFRVHLIAAAL
jgi:hypothetical protein